MNRNGIILTNEVSKNEKASEMCMSYEIDWLNLVWQDKLWEEKNSLEIHFINKSHLEGTPSSEEK